MAELDRTSSPPEDQAVSARGHGDDLKEDSREGGGDMEESREGDADVNERGSAMAASLSPEEKPVKTANITLEMLSKGGYYDMPMSKVAQLLGRTEGSFQRVCRGLGILRWPYRVRKSLQEIMAKTEEYLDDGVQEDGMTKAEVLKTLQAHMDDVKGISGNGMDKATKQYRQYIFKVNHKLARKSAQQGGQPAEKANMKVKGMLKAASKIQKSHKAPSRPAASLSVCHSGDAASDGRAIRMQPNDHHSSSTEGSQPTRPTPRHFRDLPASLAFQPVGTGEPGNIIGRMATSAAVQNRYKPSTSSEYRRICLQDDQELLRLCLEMDSHLEAAQKALSLQGPPLQPPKPQAPPPGVNPYLQQLMQASFPAPLMMPHPSWPMLPPGGAMAASSAGFGAFPPPAAGSLQKAPYEGCL